MNIQDKMQEIHHKYGVTEMANYKIQLFVDELIKSEKEQLRLHSVVERSEQLKAFADYAQKRMWEDEDKDLSEFVDEFRQKSDPLNDKTVIHDVSNSAEYTRGYRDGWRDCCKDVKEFG